MCGGGGEDPRRHSGLGRVWAATHGTLPNTDQFPVFHERLDALRNERFTKLLFTWDLVRQSVCSPSNSYSC